MAMITRCVELLYVLCPDPRLREIMGIHRMDYYTNVILVEVRLCELAGWQFEPEHAERELEWCLP